LLMRLPTERLGALRAGEPRASHAADSPRQVSYAPSSVGLQHAHKYEPSLRV